MRRFVALGDSFTAGFGDKVEGLDLRSPPDWLAIWMKEKNPALTYKNFGELGATAADVRRTQIQRSTMVSPDLAWVFCGANDCLKGTFTSDSYKAELNYIFGALRVEGAEIITAKIPDFSKTMGGPEEYLKGLAARIEKANEIIFEVSEFHKAKVFELDVQPNWLSEDGIHFNAVGNFEVAKEIWESFYSGGSP